MDIEDIYEKFDQIGCLTFATIDKDAPQTRIAHLFAYDYEGLYFRTMITKPFYEQLKKTEKVSICGMFPKTSVSHNEQGMPYFAPGYTIRATGDIKEISFKAIYQHDGQFIIDHSKCDVCGDCYTICPTSAIEIVIDDPKN